MPQRPEVAVDGEKSGILPCRPTVGLEGNLIELCDVLEPASKFLDDGGVAQGLVDWDVRVQVELRPCQREHFGRRIQLHGAAAQWDH